MSTMFHSSHIHVPRNRRPSALRTFVTSSSFGPGEAKEPLRRGILFTTVASVLLLVGSILTWLGFNDVFGGKVSMTGPLLIALALLLLLLSMRQFLIARKRNSTTRNGLQLGQMSRGTVTAVVVDRNDGLGAVTVIMDVENEPQVRNYASSGTDDYAPPSYSEVTDGNITPSGGHLDQDEPPPPYEEAVGSEAASSLIARATPRVTFDETATVLGPTHHYTPVHPVERNRNIQSVSGQSSNVVTPHCYCQPPIEEHIAPYSSPSQAAALAQDPNRGRVSSRRLFLIPHFLGVFSNNRSNSASIARELPPAYQAVDTTGHSPLTYLQTMRLDSSRLGTEYLGVQSPHESRSGYTVVSNPSAEHGQGGRTPEVVHGPNCPRGRRSCRAVDAVAQDSSQPSCSNPGPSIISCSCHESGGATANICCHQSCMNSSHSGSSPCCHRQVNSDVTGLTRTPALSSAGQSVPHHCCCSSGCQSTSSQLSSHHPDSDIPGTSRRDCSQSHHPSSCNTVSTVPLVTHTSHNPNILIIDELEEETGTQKEFDHTTQSKMFRSIKE